MKKFLTVSWRLKNGQNGCFCIHGIYPCYKWWRFYGDSNLIEFFNSLRHSWLTSDVTSARFLSGALRWTNTPVLNNKLANLLGERYCISYRSFWALVSIQFPSCVWADISPRFGIRYVCWNSIIRLFTSGWSFGCFEPLLNAECYNGHLGSFNQLTCIYTETYFRSKSHLYHCIKRNWFRSSDHFLVSIHRSENLF